MDPNVQVAIVAVFSTLITTAGIIVVAVINNQKERGKAASAGVDAGLDEGDILEKLLDLVAEVKRKETTIEGLKQQVFLLIEENGHLRDQLIDKDEDK